MASIGIHALLLFTLVVCPAFLLPRGEGAKDVGTTNARTFVFQLAQLPAQLESTQLLGPVSKPLSQVFDQQSTREIVPVKLQHDALWSESNKPRTYTISFGVRARE